MAPLAFGLVLSCYQADVVDLPWHLKTGEWIVKNHAVPRTDFFSFTRQGMEWLDAQWLFQVIIYGFYSALGPAGVTVFMMAATSLSLVLLLALVPGLPLGARLTSGLLFLLAVNLRIMPRPEMVSFVCLAGMFFVLERARRKGPRTLVWVFPLAVVWSNSEGLWPIGAFVTGVYALEAGWTRRDRRAWPWAAALAATVLAGLLQPYGPRGFWFPLTLLREVVHPATVHKQTVMEFQPLFAPPFLIRLFGPFLLLAVATTAATLAAGRKVRMGPLFIGTVFFLLAVSARRNLGIASVPLAAALLLEWEAAYQGRPGWARWDRVPAALGLSGCLVMIALSLKDPVRSWDRVSRRVGVGFNESYYPVDAVNFLRSTRYRGRIINDVGSGGYLIFRGWPEWQVSADSRLEVGGEESLQQAMAIFLDKKVFDRFARESGAEAVVVSNWLPYLRVFAADLNRDPAWRMIYVDQRAAVFLRSGSAWLPARPGA